tara:strand:- start:4274 stop:5122 length:849 start_codon:yes stop_codon:yes gene_type:complete
MAEHIPLNIKVTSQESKQNFINKGVFFPGNVSSIPMMTPNEIILFKQYIDANSRVLEYGCGGSTLYYSQFVKEWITIEHHTKWYNKIKVSIQLGKDKGFFKNLKLYHSKVYGIGSRANGTLSKNLPLIDKGLLFPKIDEELEKVSKNLLSGRPLNKKNGKIIPLQKTKIKTKDHELHWVYENICRKEKDDKSSPIEWHYAIDYINKPLEFIKNPNNGLSVKFDVVLVDGVAREFCAYKAKNILNENGYILFHDFSRGIYDGILQYCDMVEQVDSLAILKPKK